MLLPSVSIRPLPPFGFLHTSVISCRSADHHLSDQLSINIRCSQILRTFMWTKHSSHVHGACWSYHDCKFDIIYHATLMDTVHHRGAEEPCDEVGHVPSCPYRCINNVHTSVCNIHSLTLKGLLPLLMYSVTM